MIGGSLYTTAQEMVRLAQGVGGFIETTTGDAFLNESSRDELDVLRNPGQGYSLGWTTLRMNGKPVRFSHSGSLQSYRSFIAFDRRNESCVAATWTLPSPEQEEAAGSRIREVLRTVLDGPIP